MCLKHHLPVRDTDSYICPSSGSTTSFFLGLFLCLLLKFPWVLLFSYRNLPHWPHLIGSGMSASPILSQTEYFKTLVTIDWSIILWPEVGQLESFLRIFEIGSTETKRQRVRLPFTLCASKFKNRDKTYLKIEIELSSKIEIEPMESKTREPLWSHF